MDKIMLNYFENNWKPDYDKFKYSGWALLNLIPKDVAVLDIGCGYNLFKEHFDGPAASIQVTYA